MAFGDISWKMASGNGWLVWGTGYKEDYCTGGSFEKAKEEAIRILQDEEYVYMKGYGNSYIRAAGFNLAPVKATDAIEMLKKIKHSYFEEFRLTDCTMYKQDPEVPMSPCEKNSPTHLVLEITDMQGCTDHCFD